MPIHTRLMQPSDLHAVLRIQSQCYPNAYLESTEAFASKLAGANACSWVTSPSGQPTSTAQAYLVCLPVDPATFPALNAEAWQAPRAATMLYLHDLAVSPELRGSGAATALIECAVNRARALGLHELVLIAVQGSTPFWCRHGFEVHAPEHASLRIKLASFGSDATFMRRQI